MRNSEVINSVECKLFSKLEKKNRCQNVLKEKANTSHYSKQAKRKKLKSLHFGTGDKPKLQEISCDTKKNENYGDTPPLVESQSEHPLHLLMPSDCIMPTKSNTLEVERNCTPPVLLPVLPKENSVLSQEINAALDNDTLPPVLQASVRIDNRKGPFKEWRSLPRKAKKCASNSPARKPIYKYRSKSLLVRSAGRKEFNQTLLQYQETHLDCHSPPNIAKQEAEGVLDENLFGEGHEDVVIRRNRNERNINKNVLIKNGEEKNIKNESIIKCQVSVSELERVDFHNNVVGKTLTSLNKLSEDITDKRENNLSENSDYKTGKEKELNNKYCKSVNNCDIQEQCEKNSVENTNLSMHNIVISSDTSTNDKTIVASEPYFDSTSTLINDAAVSVTEQMIIISGENNEIPPSVKPHLPGFTTQTAESNHSHVLPTLNKCHHKSLAEEEEVGKILMNDIPCENSVVTNLNPLSVSNPSCSPPLNSEMPIVLNNPNDKIQHNLTLKENNATKLCAPELSQEIDSVSDSSHCPVISASASSVPAAIIAKHTFSPQDMVSMGVYTPDSSTNSVLSSNGFNSSEIEVQLELESSAPVSSSDLMQNSLEASQSISYPICTTLHDICVPLPHRTSYSVASSAPLVVPSGVTQKTVSSCGNTSTKNQNSNSSLSKNTVSSALSGLVQANVSMNTTPVNAVIVSHGHLTSNTNYLNAVSGAVTCSNPSPGPVTGSYMIGVPVTTVIHTQPSVSSVATHQLQVPQASSGTGAMHRLTHANLPTSCVVPTSSTLLPSNFTCVPPLPQGNTSCSLAKLQQLTNGIMDVVPNSSTGYNTPPPNFTPPAQSAVTPPPQCSIASLQSQASLSSNQGHSYSKYNHQYHPRQIHRTPNITIAPNLVTSGYQALNGVGFRMQQSSTLGGGTSSLLNTSYITNTSFINQAQLPAAAMQVGMVNVGMHPQGQYEEAIQAPRPQNAMYTYGYHISSNIPSQTLNSVMRR